MNHSAVSLAKHSTELSFGTLGTKHKMIIGENYDDPRGEYSLLGVWARQQGGSGYEYTTKSGKKFEKQS